MTSASARVVPNARAIRAAAITISLDANFMRNGMQSRIHEPRTFSMLLEIRPLGHDAVSAIFSEPRNHEDTPSARRAGFRHCHIRIDRGESAHGKGVGSGFD